MDNTPTFSDFSKEVDILLSDLLLFFSEQLSLSPDNFHFLFSGKKLRSSLIFYSHNIQSFKLKTQLSFVVELIHTASLVHDDIIDESTSRRGFLTLQQAYSIPQAISAGHFMFSRLFLAVLTLPKIWQYHVFKTLTAMCLGEIWEIEKMNVSLRSVKHYMQTIQQKTASLFALSCGLCDPPKWDDNESLFGWYYGTAFQLYDDLLDIHASENKLGKPSQRDSSMGIMTLPLMLRQKKGLSVQKAFEKTKNIGLNYLKKALGKTSNPVWQTEAECLIQKYCGLTP
jgi:geranylgeranyl pyrophosphate synthase